MESIVISPLVAARLREEAARCGLGVDVIADALLADALGRSARACEENVDALQQAFDRLENESQPPAFAPGMRPFSSAPHLSARRAA